VKASSRCVTPSSSLLYFTSTCTRRILTAYRFTLCDTDSRHGTRVERAGRMIEVVVPRGLRLRDGDKLYFGRTCVQFTLDAEGRE